MKVLFDISNLLTGRGGIYYHLQGLIPELQKRLENEKIDIGYIYYYFREGNKEIPDFIKQEMVNRYRFPVKLLNKMWLNLNYPNLSKKFSKVKLYHSPHFSLPIIKKAKKILTVHDITYNIKPDLYNPKYKKLNDYGYKQLLPANLRRADHIIAISNFTKNNIINHFNISPEKITTIYTGTDIPIIISSNESNAFLNKFSLLKNKYIFFPAGTIEPRKNIDLAIQAFKNANFPSDFKLIISGIGTVPQLSNTNTERIKHIKWSTIKERDILYQNSLFVIYPSLYEGFGMPAIEAMSNAKALITSNTTSLKEIAKNHAYLINPNSFEDLQYGMQNLYSNEALRLKLESLSVKRSKNFSWEKMAMNTVKIYKKFL